LSFPKAERNFLPIRKNFFNPPLKKFLNTPPKIAQTKKKKKPFLLLSIGKKKVLFWGGAPFNFSTQKKISPPVPLGEKKRGFFFNKPPLWKKKTSV
jgi:hypothetical protein